MPANKRNVMELFSEALQFFIVHWAHFLKFLTLFLVPVLCIDYFYWENPDILHKKMIQYSSVSLYILDIGLIIFEVLLVLFFLNAILLFIKEAKENRVSDIKTLVKKTLVSFPGYLHVKFLYCLKTFLWSLCLVIPGIAALFWYSFSSFAFIFDGKNKEEAFVMSKAIIKTNFIKYLDYVLFALLMLFVFTFPIITILDIAMDWLTFKKLFFWVKMIDFLEIFICSAIGIFILTFFCSVYNELKTRTAVA